MVIFRFLHFNVRMIHLEVKELCLGQIIPMEDMNSSSVEFVDKLPISIVDAEKFIIKC